jgi:hypothetical protein
MMWRDPACVRAYSGTACSEALLADCDAVSATERSLWERQDALCEGLPQALAQAFQAVDADFGSHCKVWLYCCHLGSACAAPCSSFSFLVTMNACSELAGLRGGLDPEHGCCKRKAS